MGARPSYRLEIADARDALRNLEDDSIDSIVTDPPYALVSVVKRFGAADAAPAQYGRDGLYQRASAGFMGENWDTGETAFAAEFWAECLRVLKPGGHVLAMGGTRTYHRLACAIEDAGFDIRDQLAWVYGTGFPKSHDVSKGIDKLLGVQRTEVLGHEKNRGVTKAEDGKNAFGDYAGEGDITAPATAEAAQWDGWGTALKPSWEPICLARKALSEKTIAANVLRWGTGALNIDRSRVPSDTVTGWGGGGGLGYHGGTDPDGGDARPVQGRWPANILHDGSAEVLEAFPRAAKEGESPGRFFYCAKASKRDRDEGCENLPKESNADWPQNLDGEDKRGAAPRANIHPTVKPTPLMGWQIGLVTPPGGLVLDPFTGSGSTGKAAILGGYRFIGFEREEKYAPIAEARLAWAAKMAPEDY